MLRDTLESTARGCIPPKLLEILIFYKWAYLLRWPRAKHIVQTNYELKNRHQGQRCFIMGNGPSLNRQNLLPLKNEVIFSVSSGYLHEDYKKLKPRYHCVPQLTYTKKMTSDVALEWFEEMDTQIGDAEIFLDLQEYKLVHDHQIFSNRPMHFLAMGQRYPSFLSHAIPSLDSIMLRPQSVPIMALQIALYMGFKEIYLVGVDHDWFITKNYHYAFEPTVLKGKDFSVTQDQKISSTLLDDLPMIERLWSQYRALRHVAEANNVSIYNATDGGMLDEFPRVDLQEVVG